VLRWTGVNSLRLMGPQLTPMWILTELHTTWAILTLQKVSQKCNLKKTNRHIDLQSYSSSILLLGAFYNIIMVPSKKEKQNDTLEGATVVCSIPSEDKSKPSYYHSFGKRALPTISYWQFFIYKHIC